MIELPLTILLWMLVVVMVPIFLATAIAILLFLISKSN